MIFVFTVVRIKYLYIKGSRARKREINFDIKRKKIEEKKWSWHRTHNARYVHSIYALYWIASI